MRRTRTSERGAALLIVMVAVTVLTALAADLAYDTQVSLRIAGNARDELQATYLAKGGVALSRLVLASQQDVETALAGMNLAASGIPGMQGMPALKPQLWRFIPVDSDLAGRLFAGPGGGGKGAAGGGDAVVAAAVSAEDMAAGKSAAAAPERASAQAGAGFSAEIQDEGAKVNVQLDSSYTGGANVLGTQVLALNQLICDPKWDALFEREDANGQRVSRADLMAYLRDWVDEDSQSSALAASFPAGNCSMQLTALNPFDVSYQDENYPYDRGEDRYRAKNARLDSIQELSMVAGVSDAFLAAFGNHLTVYMPRDARPNLNTTDPLRLVQNAGLIADPPDQQPLRDPAFAEKLQKLVVERTMGGLLAVSPQDFASIVQMLGVNVAKSRIEAQGQGGQTAFDDRSSVFRIVSRGRAGAVEKSIEVVIQYPKRGPAALATVAAGTAGSPDAMGKLVHWREE